MTTPVRLLVNRRIPAPIMSALRAVGDVTEIGELTAGDVSCDARVLITSAAEPVSCELIQKLPRSIGLIANLGVGVDNIDLGAARAAGMVVSNTPVVTDDTADLAMALVLSAGRRMSNYEKLLRIGRWADSEHDKFYGRSVHHKTLGIIGFGAIGQALARRAASFSMKIIYHGPHRKPDVEKATGAIYINHLSKLLKESDFVSLNCPLNHDTYHILNAQRIGEMKKGAILINTGRGRLVDEAALVEALQCGRLFAAGLDVFEFEPKITQGLLELDNVTLLPHIGSWTTECQSKMRERLLGNVRSFLQTGNPIDRV